MEVREQAEKVPGQEFYGKRELQCKGPGCPSSTSREAQGGQRGRSGESGGGKQR